MIVIKIKFNYFFKEYTNEKDNKKLKFLDEINGFVEGIQKKYESA